jgi:hypothetical protein
LDEPALTRLNDGARMCRAQPYLNSDVSENDDATTTGGASAICG